MRNKNQGVYVWGFTMIELLIVIAIIGILSTISLFALAGTREAARDSTRKSNLAAVASALEIYKSDCDYYPNSLSTGNQLKGNGSTCPSSNVYMEAIPDDPVPGRNYYYEKLGCTSGTNCTRFKLWANLEDPPASLPAGCSPAPGSCGGTCNYCILSP